MDEKLIELFFARDQSALAQSERHLGARCRAVAMNILGDRQDAEECVNDAYLALWNAIPPAKPESLTAFACRITRNLALKKLEKRLAQKRSPAACLPLEELGDCVSGVDTVESEAQARRTEELINEYLKSRKRGDRILFVRRYWYMQSIDEIADSCDMSRSKVTSSLFRTRKGLRAFLEKEGIEI